MRWRAAADQDEHYVPRHSCLIGFVRRQPDAPALAYLRVIVREPDMVARALTVA